MTAPTVAPVADLATDLRQLAVLYNMGIDKTAVFICLQEKIPGLFGEDLYAAWLPYVTAINRLDAFRVAGLDTHAQIVQAGAATDALKVLLAASEVGAA